MTMYALSNVNWFEKDKPQTTGDRTGLATGTSLYKKHFIKLACLCHSKQNDLTYLGRVCTPCLSVSSGIYGQTYDACGVIFYVLFGQRSP
jgi:hypothetical protein